MKIPAIIPTFESYKIIRNWLFLNLLFFSETLSKKTSISKWIEPRLPFPPIASFEFKCWWKKVFKECSFFIISNLPDVDVFPFKKYSLKHCRFSWLKWQKVMRANQICGFHCSVIITVRFWSFAIRVFIDKMRTVGGAVESFSKPD